MWRALTTNVAETAQAHEDPRLRGRTYAIPFEDVWSAAQFLASVHLRGWSILTSDDEAGVIHAVATTAFGKKADDVVIRISLDENAQTRVDARAAARDGRGDWGRNARRLKRFFHELDRAVVEARNRRMAARKTPGAAAGRS